MASAPTRPPASAPDSADSLTAASAPEQTETRERAAWGRRPERGMLAGVCAGVAQYMGIDAVIVRVALAMAIVAGGLGIGVYVLAWALMPLAPEAGWGRPTRAARAEGAGIVLLTLAVLAGLRGAGLQFVAVRAWPVVLGACGMALVWRATVGIPAAGGRGRGSLLESLRHARRIDIPRIAVGALLVAFASAAVLHTIGTLHSLGAAIAAVAIVTSVLGLLLGPWFLRLGRSLASERTARIREQERAEMAAHLHDSVLQTLALIQNRAADAQQVATLARRQERELRRWLFDRCPAGGDSIKAVMERAAAEVEELHGVPIEIVIVGDVPVDARLDALVQAAREAMTNAAKFADSGRIDLYVEVGDGRVEAFVRDRGVGFDPSAIPDDRRGVRDSIVARMQRHGGRGVVHSAPGEGTEVELVMGLAAA
jgi:signal transduction histidine kinase